MEAYNLEHGLPCFGFRFVEEDKIRIDVGKAKKLGIPASPLLGKLQKLETVKFKNKTILY